MRKVELVPAGENRYQALLTGKRGAQLGITISARDSAGVEKTTPPGAPAQKIEYKITDELR